jgi:FtsH-binding integral membrane protein
MQRDLRKKEETMKTFHRIALTTIAALTVTASMSGGCRLSYHPRSMRRILMISALVFAFACSTSTNNQSQTTDNRQPTTPPKAA